VHDTGLVYCDDQSGWPSPAPACEAIDNQLPAGAPPPGITGWIWKVYAAFPPAGSPRLKALPMGSTFPPEVVVVAAGLPDPVLDFEIPQGGWPFTSGGGVGICFGLVKTDTVSECYWFAGYSYENPSTWQVAPHPTQEMVFVDDSMPPQEDPITALGSIGFGQPGFTPCPQGTTVGACCPGSAECQMMTQDECAAVCGIWYGPDFDCDPNPCSVAFGACCYPDGRCETLEGFWCEQSGGSFVGGCCEPNPCGTPVDETTWGRVKRMFR
jgi:hypothetical protein